MSLPSLPQRLNRLVERVPLRSACTAIFLLAMALRLAYVVTNPDPLTFPFERGRITKALVAKGEFADPYRIPTGPTAHVAPAYPFVMSLIYRVTGDTKAGYYSRTALNSLASSSVCAMLPLLAVEMGMGPAAGIAAGLANAIAPRQLEVESIRATEDSWTGFLLAALTLATIRLIRGGAAGPGRYAMFGAAWGLSLLVATSLLPVFAAFSCILVFSAAPAARGLRLRRMAVAWLAFALVLLPWTVRNYVQLGGFVLLRSNLGIEVRSAFNDMAGHAEVADINRALHPLYNEAEAEAVRASGEIEYNRRMMGLAREWMAAHPGDTASLLAGHFRQFWFPPSGAAMTAVQMALQLAAMAGLFQLWRRQRAGALLLAAIWLFYPLVFYVVLPIRRYRHPLEWSVVLLAVFFLVSLLVKPEEQAASPPA